MANLSPCLKCEDRKVNCHSHCEKYLTWKTEHDSLLKLINENKAKEYILSRNTKHCSTFYRRNF